MSGGVQRRGRIEALRAAVGPTHAAEWPTCVHCTDQTGLAGEAFAHWVPVAGYRVEPEAFTTIKLVKPLERVVDGRLQVIGGRHVEAIGALNPPRQRGTKGWFTVIAQCHGKETSATIDVPLWWGVAHVRAAIQSLMFFGADTRPEAVLRRLH